MKTAKKLTKKQCIIIPALNEEKHVGRIVAETRKKYPDVIVVDDGSTDRTAEVARKAGAIVVPHPVNMGKGFALRTGIEEAHDLGFDTFVIMDADGQHDPEEIGMLLEALRKEKLDLVFGSRTHSEVMPFVFRFGNWALYMATKILFGTDVKDTQSGFKAMTWDAYERIEWDSKGYSAESEIAVNAGRHKLKYKEIPVKTIYSDRFKGTTVIDGARIFLRMLWWRLE